MVSISESEWQVMQAVWSGPPKTLPEILSSLQATGWSKTTIQTYLARLVKKGALTTQRQGKGYLYYPALSQSQGQLEESKSFLHRGQLEESKSFLHRVYGGSLSKMVLGFVESGTLSPQELEELKALVNQQEQRHDSH